MNAVTAEGLTKVYRLENRGPIQPPRSGLLRALGRVGLRAPFQRRAREVWALNEVSFAAQPGTILGVIGRNGAGKTTLLKLLARVSLPTAGRAIVRGRTVSLLGIGQGFQPNLSGRENIFLHAALYGVPRAEVVENFDRIVEFAGLGQFIDNPVSRYSSGMYVRLAFSVAINMRPDIILADEVLAVGDIEFQERCLQRVEQAGSEGVTVLFVSHDMEAITRLCHRVIRLDRGKIVDEGKPDEVVARYEAAIELGEWQPGGVGKTSPFVELLNVRLTSPTGREIEAARRSEDILATATFRTLVPDVQIRPSLNLGCGGLLVLRSRPSDPLIVERPGVRTVTVRIPAYLLAERIYIARFRFEILGEGGAHSVLNRDNRVTFRVYGDGTSSDPFDNRLSWEKHVGPSLIAPRLDWAVSGDRVGVHA
jgi:lipopolysaccharide transport system ATP-binding protein